MSGKKASKNSDPPGIKTVARNRKARHFYHIEQNYEAGIVLHGTEVKSLRAGRVSLVDSFAKIRRGELWMIGVHIDEYEQGNRWNHEPTRERKLLMHGQEIRRLEKKVNERGYTLIVLSIYFKHGKAKVDVGLARGKKMFDRREDIKQRDSDRDIRRRLKRDYQ